MASKTSRAHPQRDEPRTRAAPTATPAAGESRHDDQLLRQAVALWLQWNEAYERAAAQAFQTGGDQQKLEETMDRMDEVRRQAIAASRKALS